MDNYSAIANIVMNINNLHMLKILNNKLIDEINSKIAPKKPVIPKLPITKLSTLIEKISYMVAIVPSEPFDPKLKLSKFKLGMPHFAIVNEQSARNISNINIVFDKISLSMDSTHDRWDLSKETIGSTGKRMTIKNSQQIKSITDYFKSAKINSKLFPKIISSYPQLVCDNTLHNEIKKIKLWDLVAVKCTKFSDKKVKYELYNRLSLYKILPIMISTMKYYLEIPMGIIPLNLPKYNVNFTTTIPSKNGTIYNVKIIGSPIKINDKTIINYVDGPNAYIIKLPDATAGAHKNISIETKLISDLNKMKCPVISPFDIGYDNTFIIFSKLDETKIGKNIGNLDQNQINALSKAFYLFNRYVVFSGVPLNLNPDNLWWDGNKWLLINVMYMDLNDSHKYCYTLNPRTFSTYHNTYWVLKKQYNFLPALYDLNKTNPIGIGPAPFISPIIKPFFLYNTPHIDITATYELYQQKLIDVIDKYDNTKEKDLLLLIKCIYINNDMLMGVESNLLDQSQIQKYINVFSKITNDNVIFETKYIYDDFIQKITATNKLIDDSINCIKDLKTKKIEIYDGLREYTGFDYFFINNCLRKSNDELTDIACTNPIKTKLINANKFYDMLPVIPTLSNDIYVYRGLTTNPLHFPLPELFETMPIGGIFEDRTFMSTSIKKGVMGTDTFMRILLPKNTPTIYVKPLSKNPGEEEILLRPGATLKLIEKGNNYDDTPLYTFEYIDYGQPYKMSLPPKELNIPNNTYKSQKQDTLVSAKRTNLFFLNTMYNNLIESNDPIKNDRLRVMSWNVSEWDKNNIGNFMAIKDIISKFKPHVLGLQEISKGAHGTLMIPFQIDIELFSAKKELKTINLCKSDTGKYSDKFNFIAMRPSITAKNPAKEQIINLGHNKCAVYVLANIKGKDLAIITLQLDISLSINRKDNIDALLTFIKTKITTNNILLMGDFSSYRRQDYNDNQYSELQKTITTTQWSTIFDATKQLEENGFVETCTKFNQEIPINTTDDGGRVDFIYVSKNWSFGSNVKAYTYYNNESKHLPIIIDFIY